MPVLVGNMFPSDESAALCFLQAPTFGTSAGENELKKNKDVEVTVADGNKMLLSPFC